MINKGVLDRIVRDLERGIMPLQGEISILKDAVDLLSDLADTLAKITGEDDRYERETTQALKIIAQGDDHHWGNRP